MKNEFDIIRHYFQKKPTRSVQQQAHHSQQNSSLTTATQDHFDYVKHKVGNDAAYVKLGIGDDAAIVSVPEGQELAITVDTLVENIHFFSNVTPENLAHKVLAVNLSDLAAMGAKPAWITLALTLPHADESWLARFSESLHQLLQQFNIELIGGDLTHGPLAITIQAAGFLPKGQNLKRSGAKVGDKIYVSGTLGDAALGFQLINSFLFPKKFHPSVNSSKTISRISKIIDFFKKKLSSLFLKFFDIFDFKSKKRDFNNVETFKNDAATLPRETSKPLKSRIFKHFFCKIFFDKTNKCNDFKTFSSESANNDVHSHSYPEFLLKHQFVISRLEKPTPRVELGGELLAIASSCIDISDGLLADLGHILEQSHVGAHLHLEHLPLSQDYKTHYSSASIKNKFEHALTFGDDYELCFTVPAEKTTEIEALAKSHPITLIGEIISSTKEHCILTYQGQIVNIQSAGYNHFNTKN